MKRGTLRNVQNLVRDLKLFFVKSLLIYLFLAHESSGVDKFGTEKYKIDLSACKYCSISSSKMKDGKIAQSIFIFTDVKTIDAHHAPCVRTISRRVRSSRFPSRTFLKPPCLWHYYVVTSISRTINTAVQAVPSCSARIATEAEAVLSVVD